MKYRVMKDELHAERKLYPIQKKRNRLFEWLGFEEQISACRKETAGVILKQATSQNQPKSTTTSQKCLKPTKATHYPIASQPRSTSKAAE